MDNPIMEVHYSEYEQLALQSLSLRFPLKYSRRLSKSQHATRGVQGRRRQGRGQNREDLSRLDRGRSFPLPTFSLPFYFPFRHLEEDTEFLVSSRAPSLSPTEEELRGNTEIINFLE